MNARAWHHARRRSAKPGAKDPRRLELPPCRTGGARRRPAARGVAERAIRRACTGPGETTAPPPGAAAPGVSSRAAPAAVPGASRRCWRYPAAPPRRLRPPGAATCRFRYARGATASARHRRGAAAARPARRSWSRPIRGSSPHGRATRQGRRCAGELPAGHALCPGQGRDKDYKRAAQLLGAAAEAGRRGAI